MTATDRKSKLKMLDQRLSGLKSIRAAYEPMWEKINQYIAPGTGNISTHQSSDAPIINPGKDLWDGVGNYSWRLMGKGLQGYTVSESGKWVNLMPEGVYSETQLTHEEMVAIKDLEAMFMHIFSKGNFYHSDIDMCLDSIGVSTAVMVPEKHPEEDVIYFPTRHIAEIYIDVDPFNVVDTVFREFQMRRTNIIDRWRDALEDQMPAFDRYLKEAKETPTRRDTVVHGVFLRGDREPGKMDTANKPFASYFYLPGSGGVILEEGGYDSMPYIVWRGGLSGKNVYGMGESWFALPDVITSHRMQKGLLEAAQIALHPPFVAPEELRYKGINLKPYGMNYLADMASPPSPLMTAMNYPITRDAQADVEERIKQYYYTALFQPLHDARPGTKTATEIQALSHESQRMLAADVANRNKYLGQVFDRVMIIAEENGWTPPMPESLKEKYGGNIRIDYTGPLPTAIRNQFNASGFREGIHEIASLIQVFPEMRDSLNPDELVAKYLSMIGADGRMMRSEEEVQAIREERARMEQEMAEQQQEMAAAQTYKDMRQAPDDGAPVAGMVG